MWNSHVPTTNCICMNQFDKNKKIFFNSFFSIKLSLGYSVSFLTSKVSILFFFKPKKTNTHFIMQLIDCMKGLFGLDGEEEGFKTYSLCHTSCLCEAGAEEPLCTDYKIVQQFCPLLSPTTTAATTTMTTSTTTTTLPVEVTAPATPSFTEVRKVNIICVSSSQKVAFFN